MKVINESKNNLLKRKEILVEIESDKNPGYENAVKMISSDLKAPEETIVIKTLKGSFGSNQFIVNALVYDSKEDKEKVEIKPKVKKVDGQAAPAAAGGAK